MILTNPFLYGTHALKGSLLLSAHALSVLRGAFAGMIAVILLTYCRHHFRHVIDGLRRQIETTRGRLHHCLYQDQSHYKRSRNQTDRGSDNPPRAPSKCIQAVRDRLLFFF
jgi:hypothetical protein